MNKIIVWILFLSLIIGGIIGLCYLFMFAFVSIFNGLANLMVAKGAEVGLASIIAMILTVWIFFKVTSNQTVKNYITNKRSVLKEMWNEEED